MQAVDSRSIESPPGSITSFFEIAAAKMRFELPAAELSNSGRLDVRLRANVVSDCALPSFSVFKSMLGKTVESSCELPISRKPVQSTLLIGDEGDIRQTAELLRAGTAYVPTCLDSHFGITKSAPKVGGSNASEKRKRVRAKSARRREQCRANLERYRNKQRALRLELNQAMNELRQEIRA